MQRREIARQNGSFLVGIVLACGVICVVPTYFIGQDRTQKGAAKNPLNAKRIVGAWQGGLTGEDRTVVFKQDGAYEDSGANIFCEEHEIVSAEKKYKQQVFIRGQGNWRVEGDLLVISNNSRTAYWSSDQREATGVPNSTCRFQIVRLDDNLLRLRVMPVETTEKRTLFFRRIEEKPLEKEFAAVPPEYRRVLAAAELTPEEAASFVEWLKAQKLDSPAQLEVIDRLAQARQHKITLAQLFSMSPEEAAAFREVVGQVNGDYQRLVRLGANDELTTAERQAVDKATSVITDLTRLSQQLPMDVQSRASLLGGGGIEIARQIAQDSFRGFATNPIDQGGGFAGGFAAGGQAPVQVDAEGNVIRGAAAAPPAGGGRGGRSNTASGRGRGGRGRINQLAPNAETLDETQHEAVVKLNAYVANLGGWFWRTVFPSD